jgi:hypothetical protein
MELYKTTVSALKKGNTSQSAGTTYRMGKNICNVYILKEYIQNSKISIAKNQIT